ncbi:MAG: hypothetical protein SP1CHLAM14_07080 [Chlamydiales bacterium]|nr:hypothetical protein [Chlamydiales bacterium]
MTIRSNWTLGELQKLHSKPLLELIMEAMEVQKKYHQVMDDIEVDLFNHQLVIKKESFFSPLSV